MWCFAQLISVPASRRRTRCNNNTISAVNTRDVMSGVMDQLFSSVSWWALYNWGLLNSSPAIILRIKFFPKSSRHDEIEYSKLYTGKEYRTFTVLPTLIIMFNKPIQETFFTSLELRVSSCSIINKYAFYCWAVVFTFFIAHVTLMNNLSIQNVANQLKLVTNYPFIFVWVNL